jgi:hypothetical protein
MAATDKDLERRLILRTRVADGYHMTEDGLKQLQHVFTVWFPRAVFADLTDDTVRVDVAVRKSHISGGNIYSASFVKAGGTVIKTKEYDEHQLTGRTCTSFDQKRSGYYGKKDGFDYRNLFYTIGPTTATRS